MTRNTRPVHRRIALVFDFDKTLAGDSISTLLDRIGEDRDAFRTNRWKPKVENGWDPVAARFQSLVELSQERQGDPITTQTLKQAGRQMEIFDGVPDMFSRLRDAAAEVTKVELEFHILSSGLAEIIRGTSIADSFDSIAAGEFATDDNGHIVAAKRIVSHVEKTRYCHAIARGNTPLEDLETRPVDLHSSVPDDETHVPLNQMVYAGDGASDVPVFSLMNSCGGIAIGVNPSEDEWSAGEEVGDGRRVLNLASPDYRDGGEMFISLRHAALSVAHRVALSRLSEKH
jgi:phosphoserine phosphatase